MLTLPIVDRLNQSKRVLIAGAGGGFDVYAGLPLYLALRQLGKEVILGNITFTYMGGTDAEQLAPALWKVTSLSTGEPRYFPEKYLCEWLSQRGIDTPIYCFEKTSISELRRAYRWLIDLYQIDTVLLIDGGTDILMRGDESGLGTPAEDISSLAAVFPIESVTKIVSCLGFGIDAFHGVCHAHFLENVAAIDRLGGYLGSHSLLLSHPEGKAFQQAVEYAHARMPKRQSIVNGSILSALEGHFGNFQRTERTASSELFINPLMTQYWHFDLNVVAKQNLYLSSLETTTSMFEVIAMIEAFRKTINIRNRTDLPM